jgi:hypothetical protein
MHRNKGEQEAKQLAIATETHTVDGRGVQPHLHNMEWRLVHQSNGEVGVKGAKLVRGSRQTACEHGTSPCTALAAPHLSVNHP